MSRVFWDTMLFIYWIEEHPSYIGRINQIRERMLQRKDRLYTSALTLGELLSGPYRLGDRALAERYRQILKPPAVEVVSFTPETADLFGRIRVNPTIAPADAIQLACAAQAKADLFLTNDSRLSRKLVPGIQFIADLSFDYL